MSQASRAKQITDDLLRPLLRTTWKFYLGVSFLSCFVLAGLAAWGYQMYYGLAVTGDNWPVFWGFHETNFVFWIGISHAGTLISAFMRNGGVPSRAARKRSPHLR
jgi:Ni/Fe-hydrogenase subunit HybB-like protein